jgi:hypothetical protein
VLARRDSPACGLACLASRSSRRRRNHTHLGMGPEIAISLLHLLPSDRWEFDELELSNAAIPDTAVEFRLWIFGVSWRAMGDGAGAADHVGIVEGGG